MSRMACVSADIFEKKLNWTITDYCIKNRYQEHVKLSEDFSCVLRICPQRVENKFIRAVFNVAFTRAPDDHNAAFQYVIVSRKNNAVVALQDFRKIRTDVDGIRADRNFITTKSFIPDQNYTLDMDITFSLSNYDKYKSFTLRNFSEIKRSKFSKNLSDFKCKENNHSNIVLICANNETVAAHKAVLACRSPVFAKTLTNEATTYDMGENVVKEAVEQFLRFLYTDTVEVPIFDKHSVELLRLAKKFEVAGFVKLCENDLFIGTQIKIKKIANILRDLTIDQAKNMDEIYDYVNKLNECTNHLQGN